GQPVNGEVVRDLVEVDADGAETHRALRRSGHPPIVFATSAARSSVGGFSTPSPREYRANAWIVISPPSFFESSPRSLSMLPAGGSQTLSCPRSVTSLNHLVSLHAWILVRAVTGLLTFMFCYTSHFFLFYIHSWWT